ncbi:MAG: 16S rRNA (adenine(1518)-N(6)/adenine(1519)-N(6))-dimethyltransferase RsmA [Isosphaeraceae bacterium]
MPPIRQTQSYLRSLFAERGVAPQRRLGQNFLIDLNIHEVIVKAAAVGPGDVILEVGPGAGALTARMASLGAAVVAVDVDPAMVRLTTEAVAGLPNVRVLERDALAGKHRLDPAVLDAVRSGLAAGSDGRFKLVANLPYNIATPLITNLLVNPDLRPTLMVVTIQRELADRLIAPASSAAYGAVSVVVQALAEVSIVRTLPPSVFWPRPKVDSAIVAIRPDDDRRAAVGDVAWFHALVRRVFLHRRKFIRHVLAGMWPDRWTKAEVDAWLESQGLSGQLRPEALDVEDYIALAHALAVRFADPGEVPAEDEDEDEPEPEPEDQVPEEADDD